MCEFYVLLQLIMHYVLTDTTNNHEMYPWQGDRHLLTKYLGGDTQHKLNATIHYYSLPFHRAATLPPKFLIHLPIATNRQKLSTYVHRQNDPGRRNEILHPTLADHAWHKSMPVKITLQAYLIMFTNYVSEKNCNISNHRIKQSYQIGVIVSHLPLD